MSAKLSFGHGYSKAVPNKTAAADRAGFPQNHLGKLQSLLSDPLTIIRASAPSSTPQFPLSKAMLTSRLLRPAFRGFPALRPTHLHFNPALQSPASVSLLVSRRNYATPSGVKEVAVRDALNEALAEELEANDKVFVLGEEVAQYNGA